MTALDLGSREAATLVELLACPLDTGPLELSRAGARCQVCGAGYPVREGVLRMVSEAELNDDDAREIAGRDEQAAWYDEVHGGYTDRAEIGPVLAAVGAACGPVLEVGAGTGRFTGPLARSTGQPVLALDYSHGSLVRLAQRCDGLPVVAVQGDARRLPLRDASFSTALAAELYPMIRPVGRQRFLFELARVLAPRGRAAVSTLNFSLTFRAWRRLGNAGAREGENLLGGDGYYVRLTTGEFRRELAEQFDVVRIDGLRTIPGRTLAAVGQRVIGSGRGRPDLDRWMCERGVRADHVLARHALGRQVGLFLLATIERPADTRSPPVEPSATPRR